MTDTINLAKEQAEKVTISLAKRGITKFPSMRVRADLDVSGSMDMQPYRYYSRGIVEQVFQRLIGYALKFDDNGEIDVTIFNTRPRELPVATAKDYGTYVTDQITKKGLVGGGTEYAPCIKADLDALFPKKAGGLAGMFSKKQMTSNDPGLVLFFTDGDTNAVDVQATSLLMGEAERENKPVYFHLIGIGKDASFAGLKLLADRHDNCGFIHMSSIEMTDEQMYDALATDEFLAFIKKHGGG